MSRSKRREVYAAFFAAARFNAQRFLVASLIAFRPAALILRFGFAVAAGVASDVSLLVAHLARWASFMRRRAAALNFLRFFWGCPLSDLSAVPLPPSNILRSSAICESMWVCWDSKPAIA